MKKIKNPKLNDRINVFEKGRLLPHCPMKIIRVEQSRHGTLVVLNAIDAQNNARIIRHEVFTIETIGPNRPS